MEEVLKAYDGKVSYVFKMYPLGFHPWAKPAAIAGVCAFKQNNEAFWKMHNYFFEKQQEINQSNVAEKASEAAKQAGLDMSAYDACVKSPEASQKVDTDVQEGNNVGVRSTPTFFVNGHRIVGAQDLQTFKDAIEQALKE